MLFVGGGQHYPKSLVYFKKLFKSVQIFERGQYLPGNILKQSLWWNLATGLWDYLSSLVIWGDLFIRVISERRCHVHSTGKIDICDLNIAQDILYEILKRREETIPSWPIVGSLRFSKVIIFFFFKLFDVLFEIPMWESFLRMFLHICYYDRC